MDLPKTAKVAEVKEPDVRTNWLLQPASPTNPWGGRIFVDDEELVAAWGKVR